MGTDRLYLQKIAQAKGLGEILFNNLRALSRPGAKEVTKAAKGGVIQGAVPDHLLEKELLNFSGDIRRIIPGSLPLAKTAQARLKEYTRRLS